MNRTAFWGTVLFVVMGGYDFCGMPAAQAQNQASTVAPLSFTNSSLPLGIKPVKPGSEKYNIHLKDVTVVQIIEELARAANKKVIFSDEVLAQKSWPKIEVEFRDILIADLMNGLANNFSDVTSGIAWGNLGANTWLIVKRPVPSINVVKTAPILSLPAPNAYILPDATKPDNMPPGSTPFWFNGQKLYVVPLEK